MIVGFGFLLGFLFAGEALSRGLGLIVPGSIIGMVALFAYLQVRRRFFSQGAVPVDEAPVGQVANGLLKYFSILFVPAGVGIVQHLDVIQAYGPQLLAIIVVTTALTMMSTALAFTLVRRISVGWRKPDDHSGIPHAVPAQSP